MCILYGGLTLFMVLFSQIYEYFSHDVHSWSMVLSFIPFLVCALFWLFCTFRGWFKKLYLPFRCTFHGAAICFTLGMVLKGVVEIYGTTHRLIKYYWVAGAVLLAAAIFFFFRYFMVIRARKTHA